MLKSARTSVFGGVSAALALRSTTSPWEKACCASRQKMQDRYPGAGLSKEYGLAAVGRLW
eukprot:7303777-Prymnesium_polylepis.1